MTDVELTVRQVCELLDVSPRTVSAWIELGRFPGSYLLYDSRRFGFRIPAASLLAFVEQSAPRKVEPARRLVEAQRRAEGTKDDGAAGSAPTPCAAIA